MTREAGINPVRDELISAYSDIGGSQAMGKISDYWKHQMTERSARGGSVKIDEDAALRTGRPYEVYEFTQELELPFRGAGRHPDNTGHDPAPLGFRIARTLRNEKSSP